MFVRIAIVVCAALALLPALDASGKDARSRGLSPFSCDENGTVPFGPVGWRGNLTGLFPDVKVPVEWSLISTGPTEGMKCAATAPDDGSDKDVVPVDKGLPAKWLVLGPLAVNDGSADFAKELVPGEANLSPKSGDKVGDLRWQPAEPAGDGVSFLTVNTSGAKGKTNQGALAITHLFTRSAGKLRAVVEHPVQMKMFVNGKVVYNNAKYGVAVGSAYGLSNNRCTGVWPVGNSFEFEVERGWNRLTVKLMSTPRAGWNDLIFMMRLGDVPPVKYQRRNILWETPLPDHSHGAPIIVGDRIFITSEPDELICIDKRTGEILWGATNNYYDATPRAERDAHPAFKEKIEPLSKQLHAEKDPVKRWTARKKLYDALVEIDKKKYTMHFDGHLQGHFEIVGFTNTPTSDGKHVYFWNGAGVAACYDLDGKRQWIRRLDAKKLFYSAAPAVIGGRLAVYFMKMYGLDAQTGRTAWEQPAVDKTLASLLSARLAGVEVFISQQGEVVRASDGKMLWKNPHKISNDTGWAPPTVLGDVMYLPWYGTSLLWVLDFAGCTGDEWKPKEDSIQGIGAGFPPLAKAPLGISREQTAGSPLIWDGKAYIIDWCGGYYVVDLKTKKTLVCKELLPNGDAYYVAMPVAASCTLVGKHVVVMDNQGHAAVLEPGGACKEVARNRIAMQVQRDWATTTQEYTAYAPPVADGNRMYIRGERHLYCIGSN
ncbi:MAG: PQQ-binding-like beta-propeller repeat protein [Thermoguttaceae bacterium]